MDRLLLNQIEKWRLKNRKPLILLGARQTGKSYLIRHFGQTAFPYCHVFDFEQSPDLKPLFDGDLNPNRLIRELSLHQRARGNKEVTSEDLIFFDEIQECPRALTALRYFYEQMPDLAVVAAGSLLGVKLQDTFPVGRVDELTLHPMNFEEFLMASPDSLALELYRETDRSQSAHKILWQQFLDYLYVGGMPEIVQLWHDMSDAEITLRIEKIKSLQKNLLSQYYRDFAKHSGKVNANNIVRVFDNIPRQLASFVDTSTRRFRFKNVLPGQSTYLQLSGPIEWLKEAGLVLSCSLIDGYFEIPLKAFSKDNLFKLFYFDIGLLGRQLELDYQTQMSQEYGIYKGFYAENFVACELTANGHSLYSWVSGRSEIEFILKTSDGALMPIEVKSGQRTQAKSLRSYCEKFNPIKTLKLAGKVGGSDPKQQVWPIYYAGKVL